MTPSVMEPLNLRRKFWVPQKLKKTSFLDDLRILELKYERVCMGVHTHAHPSRFELQGPQFIKK